MSVFFSVASVAISENQYQRTESKASVPAVPWIGNARNKFSGRSYQSISSHIKDQNLGRADSSEVVQAGDDSGVENPEPVAAISTDPVDRD